MAWLVILAAAAVCAAFWIALGRVLPPLAARLREGPRRGPGLAPHIPHPGTQPRTWAPAVIWICNCTICYLPGGDALFVSCGEHRMHHDWQAWEHEMNERLHRP